MYAILPGTGLSNVYVVLGAHFDSSGPGIPGVNDNATGVALVLAVARIMQAVTPRSKSIVFVLFDEEERSLRGSKAFARLLRVRRLPVESVHTVDQVGWDGDGDTALGKL